MKTFASKLLLVGALLIAGTATALAQTPVPCNDQPTPPCPQGGMTGTITGGILPPPGTFTINTQGPSLFQSMTGEWCCGADMLPESWVGNGFSTVFGNIQWQFNPTLPVPMSTIRPNQASSCLPATGDLYFWVEGQIDAFPGRIFRSTTFIHVQDPDIRTCSPFQCEIFNLMNGPIDFTDLNGPPGNVAFTLTNLTVGLNP